MANTKHLMKELKEGNFGNLEELAVQAGFNEKIDVRHLGEINAYLEGIRTDRKKGSLMWVSTSHGPALLATKDLNNYVAPYANGFVRTRENEGQLEITAAGTFTEEYIEDHIDRSSGKGRTKTIIKEVQPHEPFLYLARNVKRDELFPNLIDNARKMKKLTVDDRGYAHVMGAIMWAPVLPIFIGCMGSLGGCGLSYALKTVGVDIDSRMIDQGFPACISLESGRSALGVIGGIAGLIAGTGYYACNLIPPIEHWERNVRNKNFKYQKYAVKELIKNGRN